MDNISKNKHIAFEILKQIVIKYGISDEELTSLVSENSSLPVCQDKSPRQSLSDETLVAELVNDSPLNTLQLETKVSSASFTLAELDSTLPSVASHFSIEPVEQIDWTLRNEGLVASKEKPFLLQEETTFISETDKEILNEIFTTYINHSKVSYAHSILSCYPKVKYINNNICYHNMRGPCSSQFFKVFSRLCENTSAEEANKLINIIKHVHYNNIISECEDCDSGIFEFEHKYSSYFNFVIQKGDLNVAREIYVNLPVKIDDILDECHLSGSILDMMEIYQIITDWQDILPIERKGYSVKPLHSLFYNINYEKVEFYYTIHPEVFTDNDMYQALAIVKHKAPSQVSNFKDFFDTINENNNTLIKFAGKTI